MKTILSSEAGERKWTPWVEVTRMQISTPHLKKKKKKKDLFHHLCCPQRTNLLRVPHRWRYVWLSNMGALQRNVCVSRALD